MSSAEEQAQAQAAEATQAEETVLDSVLKATPKQVKRDRAEELIKNLTEQALQGTVTFDKSVSRTLMEGVKKLDAVISKQLAAILHDPKFQKLEGTWRGLNYLVMNSETGTQLKIKVLNAPKRELFRDFDKAVEFDQSEAWKKLYENEFGHPGGEPYGALIGDYEFTNHPDDMRLLQEVSHLAAGAFCPFISAAEPGLFGFEQWTELSKPRDLARIFDSVEYTQWASYRDSEDSRFVTLAMPRVLSRLPYGANTKPIDEFAFEEVELGADGKPKSVAHNEYCWMNAAYVYGTRLTDAFAKYGFCTAIRGEEGGGKVEGLPAHIFTSDDGDPDLKCPTEVGITDRREKELSDLGFLPLCHYKNKDFAVFFGAQTTQKPKKYDRAAANDNAQISARLPYIMATARFAHYLKVMARGKIGSFMEREDCEKWLNRWINNYVNTDPNPGQEMKARFPLREAKVKVEEVPGAPGSYNAIAWLRPWLQFEELTASLRMVARIPENA